MNKLPRDIENGFSRLLNEQGVAAKDRGFFIKWLRYYWDFCLKYNFIPSEKPSLPAFIKKLEEKNQPEALRLQAEKAINLFWKMQLSGNKSQVKKNLQNNNLLAEPDIPLHNKESLYAQVQIDTPKEIIISNATAESEPSVLGLTGADWRHVYTELANSIKLRHYSIRTLKSYVSYTRGFQAYVKSKDPRLLGVNDVKAFLTSLAVDKGVAAASQNLAFNALLYLFRNVLGKDFGKVDGVVRAKRKPYIPVVLSRSEIDVVLGCLQNPYRLVIKLMYGCGLRISECLSLRVQNFNFDMKVLTLHDGKGKKDRTVPLPESLLDDLKRQLHAVIELHEKDCQRGCHGVFLVNQLGACRIMPFSPTSALFSANQCSQYHLYGCA